MAVPSIMYGMNVMKWTKGELDKLDVIQNKVGRMALGANIYVGVEAVRGEKLVGVCLMAELNYKVRMERMSENRWVKKVFMWNSRKSMSERACKRKTSRCGPQSWAKLVKKAKVKLQLLHLKCSLVSLTFLCKTKKPKVHGIKCFTSSFISSFTFKQLLLEKSSVEQ